MADTEIPRTPAEFRYFIIDVVKTLAAFVQEKDPYLKKHSKRVANNCANFCEQFKLLKENDVENLYLAGLLHDIGIVGVPLTVLHKTEALTEEEMVLIKKHPVRGEKILSNLDYLKNLLPIIRHHHEAVDGSGYPDGLEKEEIPLGARVLGLFNHFDNLVYPRMMDQAVSIDEALKDIQQKAEKLFDADLIPDFTTFIKTTSGRSENFLQKKELDSIKAAFAEILQKFKAGKIEPPVMPQVVRDVQNLIKESSTTAEDLADAIAREPVIALRLISIANSPIYRGVQEIVSLKTAIPRLGIKETLSVVIAIANKSLYETDRAQYKILMDNLWVHALASAFGAKIIAAKLKLEDEEKYFLMGLTHDIGKILLLKAYTDVSKSRRLDMDTITANLQEAHIGLGKMLLKRWGLGDDFINVVARHEDTEFEPDTAKEILVVSLANMLTRKIGFSLFDADFEFVDLVAADSLGIDPEAADAISEEIKQIIQDVAHLF